MGVVTLRPWLRRNALALSALGVLLIGTVVGIGGPAWWSRYETMPVFPHTVAIGETGTFGGASWRVRSVEDVSAQVLSPLPSNGRALTVTVEVSPDDDELTCRFIRLSELGGAHRQWNANPPDVELPYDDEVDVYCDASEGDFLLGLTFLVPRDVDGPLALDIPVEGETPAFVRLELPR